MPFGIDEVNYALKRVYPKYPPMNVAVMKHPFSANTPKEGVWFGEENFKQGVEYGNPQGGGGDFTKGQAVSQLSSTKGIAFDVPRRWKYWFAQIAGKAIVATGNDSGAFFKAVKRETDNGFRGFGDRLATDILCGDGTGTLGIVATGGVSGNVITLASIWHARRFKEGMAVEFSTDGTLANVRAYTSPGPQVTKVNYRTGQVTFNNLALVTGGGGAAQADFMAAAGDFDTGFYGASTWIPLNDPSASLFCGVDRTKNITLLSGHRLPSSSAGAAIKENAQDLGATMATTGATPDAGYLSPLNWNRLQKELGAEIKRDVGEGKFGFPYIAQAIGGGELKWFMDADMEDDRGYMFTTDTWVIRHAYGWPHLDDDDGRPAQRAANAPTIEVRMRTTGNLFNLGPGMNGVFPITPPS